MRRIGVLVAMEREARATLSDPFFAWKGGEGGLWVSETRGLRLLLSGVGKAFASYSLAQLSADSDLILSLGTSGRIGKGPAADYCLAVEFVEHDMDARALGFARGVTPFCGMKTPVIVSAGAASVDLARRAAAAAELSFLEGRATSGDSFLSDAEEARALAEWTGAEVVDMECAALAKLCALKASCATGGPLEFLALRAMSDKADGDATRSFAARIDGLSRGLAAFLRAFVEFCDREAPGSRTGAATVGLE